MFLRSWRLRLSGKVIFFFWEWGSKRLSHQALCYRYCQHNSFYFLFIIIVINYRVQRVAGNTDSKVLLIGGVAPIGVLLLMHLISVGGGE